MIMNMLCRQGGQIPGHNFGAPGIVVPAVPVEVHIPAKLCRLPGIVDIVNPFFVQKLPDSSQFVRAALINGIRCLRKQQIDVLFPAEFNDPVQFMLFFITETDFIINRIRIQRHRVEIVRFLAHIAADPVDFRGRFCPFHDLFQV